MATVTPEEMKKTQPTAAGLKSQYDVRETTAQNKIGNLYDTQINAQRSALTDAFNKNMQDQEAAKSGINQNYLAANQDLNTQFNRNQTGLDQFATVRDVNTQPGSQQSLSLNMARTGGMGQIGTQYNQAMQEAGRQAELLKTGYQNQVSKALADSDYRRAAALLDDYNNQQTWRENQAKILASYGNFSGYENLYGPEQANQMRNMWVAQNPELAYNTGAIDGKRYTEITGLNPPDYRAPASSGGGGTPTNWGDRWWEHPWNDNGGSGYQWSGNTY